MTENAVAAAFTIAGIHALDVHYDLLDGDTEDLPELGEDRPVGFIWDWNVLDEDTVSVLLGVQVGATRETPERVRYAATAVAVFGEAPTHPGFFDLIRVHLPAIIFPYLREGVANLTSRGPYGLFQLPPTNVAKLAERFPLKESSGYERFQKEPKLRKRFGLGESPQES